MAISVTDWPQSLDYRIIYDSAGGVSVASNTCGVPVSIRSIIIDNTAGTDECFLKVANEVVATAGTTEPDWLLPCNSGKTANYDFSAGLECNVGLCFWVTRNEATSDQTVPAVTTNGTVKVTLLVSHL